MSNNVLSSSKVALALAAVTVGGAVIFAALIGPNSFVKSAKNSTEAEQVAENTVKAPEPTKPPVVFSDYRSDEELGFAPAKDSGSARSSGSRGFDNLSTNRSAYDEPTFEDDDLSGDGTSELRSDRGRTSSSLSRPSETNIKLPRSEIGRQLDANPPVLD